MCPPPYTLATIILFVIFHNICALRHYGNSIVAEFVIPFYRVGKVQIIRNGVVAAVNFSDFIVVAAHVKVAVFVTYV